MGQGLYTLLGYGVLDPPWLDEDVPAHAAAWDALEALGHDDVAIGGRCGIAA